MPQIYKIRSVRAVSKYFVLINFLMTTNYGVYAYLEWELRFMISAGFYAFFSVILIIEYWMYYLPTRRGRVNQQTTQRQGDGNV